MKSRSRFVAVLYVLLFGPGLAGLCAEEERTVGFSGDALWRMSDYRAGLVEGDMIRPGPVLRLSSERGTSGPSVYSPDLVLSFDEADPSGFRDSLGRYSVSANSALLSVDRLHSRVGSGAVLFRVAPPSPSGIPSGRVSSNARAAGPLVVEPKSPSALFAAGGSVRDFSLEFWLYPFNMENGERVLEWGSSGMAGPVIPAGDGLAPQRIAAVSSRNRLQWSFSNFFISPDRGSVVDVSLSGVTPLVPRTWSHHLIRFDAQTGMIEYLVNGVAEAVSYVTSTGREGGEVRTPFVGRNGGFVLGGHFTGMMDEFRIHGEFLPGAATRRYPTSGGRIETRAIDLGVGNNRVLSIEASGGRTSMARNERASGEFRRNGRFRFPDGSEMQFFVRASNNPFRWDAPWHPAIPGEAVTADVVGRYVQLAVDFYPSADGETTPYLEEVGIVFMRDEPPLPPSRLVAVAMDGAVRLTWRHSPNRNTAGYLVYYGTSENELFGEGASLGPSPISVGMENSVVIDGLRNGTLYFFRVAAYSDVFSSHLLDGSASHHVGEFSNEARARPLPLP